MPHFVSSITDGYQFLGRTITAEGRAIENIELIFGKSESEIFEMVKQDGNVTIKPIDGIETKKNKKGV